MNIGLPAATGRGVVAGFLPHLARRTGSRKGCTRRPHRRGLARGGARTGAGQLVEIVLPTVEHGDTHLRLVSAHNAGMTGTMQMLALMRAAQKASVKLILQGDTNQIANVNRGDPLVLMVHDWRPTCIIPAKPARSNRRRRETNADMSICLLY